MSGSTGGQLPSGWSWTSLDNVSNLLSGNPAPQGKEKFRESGPPFVRVQDMGRLGTRMRLADTKDHLAESVVKSLRMFPAGSVLFTKSGASTLLNQRAVLQRPMYIVSHIAAAIPEKGILSEWLYHWLSTVDFSHYAHATTLPSLPFSKIKQIAVPVAPRTEQTRIADTLDELFSDLDAGVAALKRARDRLQLYRASVLKAAVEGPLTADWRKQHSNTEPASELLKHVLAERRRRWEENQLHKFEEKGKAPPKNWKAKYKAPVAPDTTGLPPLPEGWCWATFAEIANQRLGKMLDKAKNVGRLRSYLRNVNTRWFSFDLDDLAEMRIGDEEFPNVSVQFGDLVVCEGGEPGRCAVWDRKNESIAIQKALHRIRPSRGVSSHYLSFVLAAGTYNGRLKKAFTGTGINHLTGESLASYPVPLPPSSEQEAIVATVNNQFSVIEQVEADIDAKLQSAQILRQSILKHAFAGKLVPQDPNDEPATELLKRIAAERVARTRKTAAAKGSGSARRRRQRSKPK